jgi:hypothetical protein
MHLWECGKQFWNSAHEFNKPEKFVAPGTTSLAVADFWALREEFIEAERGQGFNVRHQVQVCVTTEQLRYLVDNMPDAFADIPPLTHDEAMARPADEVETYQKMLAEDPDGDTWGARFSRWLKSKRLAQPNRDDVCH